MHDRHKEKDIKDRSIKLTGLPPKTQDGLLQQCLDKLTNVKRVEVFNEKAEAIVELAAISVRRVTFRLDKVYELMGIAAMLGRRRPLASRRDDHLRGCRS